MTHKSIGASEFDSDSDSVNHGNYEEESSSPGSEWSEATSTETSLDNVSPYMIISAR